MTQAEIQQELAGLIKEFDLNPLHFFWILHDSDNENLDFRNKNIEWAFVKSESWHNLDLADYQLWAISDNGDLLWWNGEQTVAMRPRDQEFISTPARPSQFVRLLASGRAYSYFPKELCGP